MRTACLAWSVAVLAATPALAGQLAGTWDCQLQTQDNGTKRILTEATTYSADGRFNTELTFREQSATGSFEADATTGGVYTMRGTQLDLMPIRARVTELRVNGAQVTNRSVIRDIRSTLLEDSAPLTVVTLTSNRMVLERDGLEMTCDRR